MPLTTYTSVCTKKLFIAEAVYEFSFTKPEGFSFQPGQFILFNVPLIDNPADIQTRAFSVASTPSEDELLFVVKLIEGGRASRWFEETLREGSAVTFTGPFGRFLLNRASEKEFLFIATGTGIAPFRSMILEALKAGDTRRMDIVFGVKNETHLFWTDWLRDLCQKYPNVFVHDALSQPSSEWKGHHGRVQTLVPLIVHHDFSRKTLYACGSPQMTVDVKKLALEEWGMEKKDVHVEGYI